MEKQVRDKELTKQKILDAVGNIIIEDGIGSVGINSVARKAKVDKVLIYRYFENFEGLMYAYIISKDFYGNVEELNPFPNKITSVKDVADFTKRLFINQLRHIKNNIELQEIFKWEMSVSNSATKKIAEKREEHGKQIFDYFKKNTTSINFDAEALITIIIGGIYYLVLRANTIDVFNGIKINENEGEERIINMIENIVDKYVKEIQITTNKQKY